MEATLLLGTGGCSSALGMARLQKWTTVASPFQPSNKEQENKNMARSSKNGDLIYTYILK